MMDITEYIRSDAFILVPALYIIGLFLRQTPHIPFWTHSWIKLIFSVFACLLHYGYRIESVIQGILVTGAAVVSRDLLSITVNGIDQRKQAKLEKQKEKDQDELDS
jgi:Phage holin family Hol44, in holin superfamily V